MRVALSLNAPEVRHQKQSDFTVLYRLFSFSFSYTYLYIIYIYLDYSIYRHMCVCVRIILGLSPSCFKFLASRQTNPTLFVVTDILPNQQVAQSWYNYNVQAQPKLTVRRFLIEQQISTVSSPSQVCKKSNQPATNTTTP